MNDHELMLAGIRRAAQHGGLDELPQSTAYVADMSPLFEQKRRLTTEIKAARARTNELNAERATALRQDAKALRAGTALPTRSQAAIDADVAEQKRREDAARRGLVAIDQERAKLLETKQREYFAELTAALAPGQAVIHQALADLQGVYWAQASLEAAIATVAQKTSQPVTPTLPSVDGVRVDQLIATLAVTQKMPTLPLPPDQAGKLGPWERYGQAVGAGTIGNNGAGGRYVEAAAGARRIAGVRNAT